jgi:hypothetical protein
MKTLSFAFYLILSFTAMLVNSCNKENEIVPPPVEQEPAVIKPITKTNAYVQSIMSDGHPVYALVLEAKCTNHRKIEKVVVDGPHEQYELILEDDGYGLVVFKNSGIFAPTPPECGTYTFRIRFLDGLELSSSITVLSPFLLPSGNAKAELVLEDNKEPYVELVWDAVPNADYYKIHYTFIDGWTPEGGLTMSSEKLKLGSKETGEMKFWAPMGPPISFQFEVEAVDLKDGSDEDINSVSLSKAEINIDSL